MLVLLAVSVCALIYANPNKKEGFPTISAAKKTLMIVLGDVGDELERIEKEWDRKVYDLVSMKSSGVYVADWNSLAGFIFSNYGKYDGFVVLTKPDTLTYTATALTFLLENIDKPIVVSSDSKHALQAVKAKIPEVVIADRDILYRACTTRKVKGGYFSIIPPLKDENGKSEHILKPVDKLNLLQIDSKNSILVIKLFPGITKDHISKLMNDNVKGIVLETYHKGHLDLDLATYLKELCDEGVVIVSVSQSMDIVNNPMLEAVGIISGKGMTTETALIKLYVMLTYVSNFERKQIEKMMLTNMRGELVETEGA